jgi:hypothetical protein
MEGGEMPKAARSIYLNLVYCGSVCCLRNKIFLILLLLLDPVILRGLFMVFSRKSSAFIIRQPAFMAELTPVRLPGLLVCL